MNDYRYLKCIKVLIFGTAAVLLLTYVTMLLWNWLVPELFSGSVISYWQTLGLLVLSKIFFSGFGGKRGCSPRQGGFWKNRLQEKMEKMTPEEKERFKAKFKGCWMEKDS